MASTLKEELGLVSPGLAKVILAIAEATADVADILRYADTGKAGGSNTFGDFQLEADIATDRAVWARLRESGVVEVGASEETSGETVLNESLKGSGFSVAFDPLDGSSVFDANFAVGSIFGVWPGRGFVGRTGGEQAAAAYALYGPKTVLVVATKWVPGDPAPSVMEFRLGPGREFKRARVHISISPKATHCAPANLRAVGDNTAYRDLLNFWLDEKFTLRYSGAMVPDVHHILTKGQGVFCSAGGAVARPKLRCAFEVFPLSYIVEAAGGKSSDGAGSALERKLVSTDDKCAICLGSSEEVERARTAMACCRC